MSAEPLKRLVVATDFSEGSELALDAAIRFAKLLGATIDLVHVYPMSAASVLSPIPGVVPMPPPPPDVLDEIEQRLEVQGARVRESGVDRLVTTEQGVAADEIVAYAHRTGAELIVMGTHGRTGLRRVFLGSVAEQVLHKARCPVLVVPRQVER